MNNQFETIHIVHFFSNLLLRSTLGAAIANGAAIGILVALIRALVPAEGAPMRLDAVCDPHSPFLESVVNAGDLHGYTKVA
jgi:hypothetical protein